MEQLEARRLLAADFEPNNSIAEAVNLGNGNQFHSDPVISPADQSDWYRWTASTSGTVRVDANFSHNQGDLVLSLHNASGSTLVRSDSISDNERASIQVSPNQVVLIHVSSCTNPIGSCDNVGVFADYSLNITEIRADGLESNNSIGSATSLGSSGQSVNGLTIHSPSDTDFFRFTAASDGDLIAEIDFSHAEGDLDLFVYDVFGDLLTSSQSETNDEFLQLAVVQGNDYIVEVREVTGAVHPRYNLDVRLVSPPVISGLPNIVSGFVGAPTTIPFTVIDSDTSVDSLLFVGVSDNQAIIPNSGITFGGNGEDRFVTIAPNDFGINTLITITVNDLRGGIAERQFLFSQFLRPSSAPPSLSPIGPQTINEDSSTGPIFFIASDDNTPVANLSFSATSSDTVLIPNNNITINPGTPSSSIIVTPAADRSGTAEITLVAEDQDGIKRSVTFPVTVNPVDDPGKNDPPTFDFLSDLSINEDAGQQTIIITGVHPGGSRESGQTITLSATSSDPQLLAASISNTTLRLTPAANRFGVVRVTVQARDNGGGVDTYRQSFDVVINDVNDPPTMSTLQDVSISDGTSASVGFTIGDLETPPSLLLVTAVSSNPSVVPNQNIMITGDGVDRTVKVSPAPGQSGEATISVTVSDGEDSVSDTYKVIVVSSNAPPILSGVADQTIDEDAPSPRLSFTVGDVETDPSNLIVTVSSSNQGLIPNSNLTLGGLAGVRTLDVAPLADQSGTATITLSVQDEGVPPLVVSETFDITVRPTNDAPTFTLGPNQVVSENAGPQSISGWVTNIAAGPADEQGQVVVFSVTNNNPGLFLIPPAISPAGDLTFTPAADTVGVATVSVSLADNGGTGFGGADTSAIQEFTIVLGSINDEPSFDKGANQAVNEDAGPQSVAGWATNISPGPGNESDQDVEFEVIGNSNNALFSQQPAISPTGVLTYTPAPDANGIATISVQLVDDGGTTNGGDDTSDAQTFTIFVNPVNDPPIFVPGPDQSIAENSGPQTVENWATLSPGPADESGQTLEVRVLSNSNPSLFASPPRISPAGTLSYIPAGGAEGSATISATASDNGLGSNASTTEAFSITIGGVNDPPSFTRGPDPTTLEDAGEVVIPDWASNVTPGPDEASQTVRFEVVGNTNPDLFDVAPRVSASGELTYTTAPDANGSAIVTIQLRDDGGTEGNGSDVSPPQSLQIDVTPVNDGPSFTAGPDISLQEGAGAQTFSNWATNILPGPPNEADQIVDFRILENSNPELFSVSPSVARDGTLSFEIADGASGTAMITLRVFDHSGTANDGVDISLAQTFTIATQPINNEPSFVKGPDQTIAEDSGDVVIPAWATDISAGGRGETDQQLSFEIVSISNSSLFETAPAISAEGQLTYSLTPNAFGVAAVTFQLVDDGGTAGGGDDTSPSQTFTVNVTPINDPPSFVPGDEVNLSEDSGMVTIPDWAQDVSAGPGETDQLVRFSITSNSNPDLFELQPTISADGTVSLSVKPETSGVATLAVVLSDNGGTVNGGLDTAEPQRLTVNVATTNDLPAVEPILDQVVSVGASTVLAFRVSDAETPARDLLVTATSSDPTVIPNGSLALSGTTEERMLQVTAGNTSGTTTITVNVSDDEATVVETFDVTVVDNQSPVVVATERNDGNGRFDSISSIAFRFDENVGGSIHPSDLVLTDSLKGTQPNLSLAQVEYDPITHTARFDLSRVDLPKGRYLASLRGNAVHDTDGNSLDGNQDGNSGDDYVEIMVLTFVGDANLDLAVDFEDFSALAAVFGSTDADWPQGDFNGDRAVDFDDFVALSAEFGNEVVLAVAEQAAMDRLFVANQARPNAAVDSVFDEDDGENERWDTAAL